jgi:hypothetical protein
MDNLCPGMGAGLPVYLAIACSCLQQSTIGCRAHTGIWVAAKVPEVLRALMEYIMLHLRLQMNRNCPSHPTLHAACARVANLSETAKYIYSKVFRDMDEGIVFAAGGSSAGIQVCSGRRFCPLLVRRARASSSGVDVLKWGVAGGSNGFCNFRRDSFFLDRPQ